MSSVGTSVPADGCNFGFISGKAKTSRVCTCMLWEECINDRSCLASSTVTAIEGLAWPLLTSLCLWLTLLTCIVCLLLRKTMLNHCCVEPVRWSAHRLSHCIHLLGTISMGWTASVRQIHTNTIVCACNWNWTTCHLWESPANDLAIYIASLAACTFRSCTESTETSLLLLSYDHCNTASNVDISCLLYRFLGGGKTSFQPGYLANSERSVWQVHT